MTQWSQDAAEYEFSDRQVADGMSEALTYLIGVALSAGLDDVARKLSDANADLAPYRFARCGREEARTMHRMPRNRSKDN